MAIQKRNRARILTPDGLRKLNGEIRQRELDDNAGSKFSLERLGEITGLDPETVRKVLNCQGSDKRTLTYCFNAFGLALSDADHRSAPPAIANQGDPNFVGREEAMADLTVIFSRSTQVIVIQAKGGVGKTTLAKHYLRQIFGTYLEFSIAKETQDIANAESLLEEKLRQLGEEPGREFLVSLDRLKRKLQEKPIGILIDNLEPALDSTGKFIEPHRRYVELLRVLSDPTVQSTTLITSRERLRESSISVQHYLLKSLAVLSWEQFFSSRELFADTSSLANLHKAYGGNAKAMEIICSAVLEDFDGDVKAYWEFNQNDLFVERDLEDLVAQQFDRLRQVNTSAYKLLYRMGCYRYQDVPKVPEEGLICLLWDVSKDQQKRVIKELRDRSLIEFQDRSYWLHPTIRSEAITRLRKTDDWVLANENTAIFFETFVSRIEHIKDALFVFEAFYQYWNINNTQKAINVLFTKTKNRGESEISLGIFFYRMSLFQQLSFAISKILDTHEEDINPFKLNGLYHWMGNINWGKGNIHYALEYQEKAKSALERCKNCHIEDYNFSVESRFVLYLFNVGLYKIYLWELGSAIYQFEEAIAFSIKNKNDGRTLKSESFMAFAKAAIGQKDEALKLAEKSFQKILSGNHGEIIHFGFYLWILGRTFRLLEKYEAAIEAFEKSSLDNFYEDNAQARARLLYGLAEVDLDNGNFESSMKKCQESVNLLRSIGAKSDLAEAYFQLGNSKRLMDDSIGSSDAYSNAIKIFEEMQAPRQIERVKEKLLIRP